MTKDEALKLALEALERLACLGNGVMRGNSIGNQIAIDALTAIKEALAQPEHERFLVATIGNWGRVEWADGVFPSLGDKMYSAPSTWVGLTDEEAQQTFAKHNCTISTHLAGILARAIEAKLKEKNHV